MSTWPVKITGPIEQPTELNIVSRFGSQIVIPLISSLVSANTLNRQTHLHHHVPVSVCVCVCLSVRVQYKPPSPDDFVNLGWYNVSVFAIDCGPSLALGDKDSQTL